jgi:putative flippase GtrA
VTDIISERVLSHSARSRYRGLEFTRFVRANGSSIVATLVEWGLVKLMVTISVHYLIAAAVGAVVGAIMDFSLKRHWAFVRGQIGTVHGEAARYVIASALSLIWNLVASYVLVSLVGLPKVTGVIVASVIVGLVWNYPVHRIYVFHDRHHAS